MLLSSYLWNRAINTDPARPPNVAARFEFALIVLIGFGTARIFNSGAELVGPVNRAIFWFFLVGMLALALRRAQMEGTRSRPVFSTRWLLLSLAVVGGLLLVGAVLATVFSRDLGAVLFQPVLVVLGLLGWVLWTIFTWLVEILFWLLTPLIDFIHNITGNDAPRRPDRHPCLASAVAGQPVYQPQHSGPAPAADRRHGGAAGALPVVALLVAGPPSAERGARGGARNRSGTGKCCPGCWPGCWAAAGPGRRPTRWTHWPAMPRYRYTVQVRRIYRQLLDLAETRGVPRPVPDTADELLPALERVLPGDPAPLRAITDIYDTVRYRNTPATAEEAAAATEAWAALGGR